MRTYKEYYQFGLDDELDWKSKQKDIDKIISRCLFFSDIYTL